MFGRFKGNIFVGKCFLDGSEELPTVKSEIKVGGVSLRVGSNESLGSKEL